MCSLDPKWISINIINDVYRSVLDFDSSDASLQRQRFPIWGLMEGRGGVLLSAAWREVERGGGLSLAPRLPLSSEGSMEARILRRSLSTTEAARCCSKAGPSPGIVSSTYLPCSTGNGLGVAGRREAWK